MTIQDFDNFGDLYRAAFAESDPEIKQILLSDVKRALDLWANSEAADVPRPAKASVSSVSRPASHLPAA